MNDNIKKMLYYRELLDEAINALKVDINKLIDDSADVKNVLEIIDKEGYGGEINFFAEVSIRHKGSVDKQSLYWTEDDKAFLEASGISSKKVKGK
jgi:hypothetical protein